MPRVSQTGRGKSISIDRTKGGYRLHAAIETFRPAADVFAFFSNAANLDRLTPRWLRFEILTPMPITMRAGLRLDYRLRLRGFPIRWQSEITVWDPPHRFVDEQRSGPYRRWVHEHIFEESDTGTTVIDKVDYAVIGGRIIHALLVGRDLRSIFAYRHAAIGELFAVTTAESPDDHFKD